MHLFGSISRERAALLGTGESVLLPRRRGGGSRLARRPVPARWRVGATVLGVLSIGACSPSLDWREVRPAGVAVVAMLPCKPNVVTRTLPLAGVPVRLTMLACKAEQLHWALAVADLGDPARVGPALDAMREGIRANLEGRVVEVRRVAVPGATPHEAQVRAHVLGRRQDGTPMAAHMIVFSYGTQVFQAVVMGEVVPEGPAATFFESLRAGP